ncbi:MAG TPA: recombinase family protein [Bryobacteraceae bacterium]|jgi:hypothetical protein
MADHISYLRVSTDKQGITGLGMHAQRDAVGRYVQSRGHIVAPGRNRGKAVMGMRIGKDLLYESHVSTEPAILKSVGAKVQIGALAILISAIPGLAADTVEWGQPVNGLRLSISIQPYSGNPAIQVTLENVGDQFLLVPIGALAGNSHPMLLKMYVTTPDGKAHSVLGGFGLAGGSEPLIIYLRSQESFTVQRSISSYYLLDDVPADLQAWPGLAFLLGPEKLETLILRRCQLWVELEQESTECMLPKGRFDQSFEKQAPVPCWHGKVATNILRFPN